MIFKFPMTGSILTLIFVSFVAFYFFYFIWYSFWYYPAPKNPEVKPPSQPETGPGGKEYLTQEVEVIEIKEGEDTAWIFIPKGIDLNSSPVILFLHGLAPTNPDYTFYHTWLYHEVKRGNIVIFPIYQRDFFHPFWPRKFPDIAYNLSKKSIEKVKEIVPQNDLSKFIIIGTSLGGAIATNIISKDLPQPKALILLAPGQTFPFVPSRIYGVPFGSLESLSKDCSLVTILAGNDHLISSSVVIKKIFRRATHLKEKHLFKIPSDTYGNPVLWSNHLSPFGIPSALGFNGYWKIIDATLNCVFYDKDCDIVRGESERAFSMGRWSDGKEINRIIKIPID
jgi:hypothetical protein